jgi:tetratricopeptide (TPR) repeat protein
MLRFLSAVTIGFAALASSGVNAEPVGSMAEAKKEAERLNRPILIEFFHDDCEYCSLAAREAESEPLVKIALNTVVNLAVNIASEGAAPLIAQYQPGASFPVFILTNAGGDVIHRWTGYTTADRFIADLNTGLSDLATIDERRARLERSPNFDDASRVATYFFSVGDFLTAIEYYRLMQDIYPEADYSFQIFRATAEAVWNEQLPFDTLALAAAKLLLAADENLPRLADLAAIMRRVAQRTGHTDQIAPYIQAGAQATMSRKDQPGISLHRELLADYMLYVMRDTAEALSVKKKALGDGWEEDPARNFEFGKYCFDRGLNLEEAENYVRRATNQAREPGFKARHLKLLSEIVLARGRPDEAIALLREAIDLDPWNLYYQQELKEITPTENQ